MPSAVHLMAQVMHSLQEGWRPRCPSQLTLLAAPSRCWGPKSLLCAAYKSVDLKQTRSQLWECVLRTHMNHGPGLVPCLGTFSTNVTFLFIYFSGQDVLTQWMTFICKTAWMRWHQWARQWGVRRDTGTNDQSAVLHRCCLSYAAQGILASLWLVTSSLSHMRPLSTLGSVPEIAQFPCQMSAVGPTHNYK